MVLPEKFGEDIYIFCIWNHFPNSDKNKGFSIPHFNPDR